MTRHCPNCLKELEINSTSCANCGLEITPEISPKINKKITTIVAVIAVVVIVIIAAIIISYQSGNPLSNLGYSNTENGFGLNPPAGWTTEESGIMGTIVIFYAPNDNDIFKENINVVPTELPSGTTLSSFVDSVQNQLSSYLTNSTLLSSNARTINGMNAYEYIYKYTQGIYDLKAKQVLVEKNSKLIIITYTAGIDGYDTYEYGLEQCINSLKIV
jgi:hypothetical protein